MARPKCGAGSTQVISRCRLVPELVDHCRPEKKDTKEHWKMLKRILKFEKGEVPDRNARGWKVEGEMRRATRKECKWLMGE